MPQRKRRKEKPTREKYSSYEGKYASDASADQPRESEKRPVNTMLTGRTYRKKKRRVGAFPRITRLRTVLVMNLEYIRTQLVCWTLQTRCFETCKNISKLKKILLKKKVGETFKEDFKRILQYVLRSLQRKNLFFLIKKKFIIQNANIFQYKNMKSKLLKFVSYFQQRDSIKTLIRNNFEFGSKFQNLNDKDLCRSQFVIYNDIFNLIQIKHSLTSNRIVI